MAKCSQVEILRKIFFPVGGSEKYVSEYFDLRTLRHYLLIKDIVALEKVQRRASRPALRQKRGVMSYEHRCSLLKWQRLEKRREFLSLVQCFRF